MYKNKKKQILLYTTRKLVWFLAFLLIVFAFSGCGGNSHLMRSKVSLRIKPELNANNGRPFYIVIREVNKTSFLIDGYDEIAEMVYADQQEESLITWCVILPGKENKIKFAKPEKSDLGVYGLFTQPGDNWKIMINKPLGSKYEIIPYANGLKYYRLGFLKKIFGKDK